MMFFVEREIQELQTVIDLKKSNLQLTVDFCFSGRIYLSIDGFSK